MPQVVASSEIAVPPERIWEIMCEPSRYPEWVIPTDRMIEVPESLGEGSVYREYGGVPPFKGESEWKVTQFEPHRKQVHEGDDGSMAYHLTIDIEPAGDGSRLTQTLVLTPRWFLAPVNAVLWPLMMRKRAQDAMDGTVENVKRELEGGGS